MMHGAFVLIFFLSVLFAPWWLAGAVAVFILAEWRDWISVLFGAILLDLLFGVPVVSGYELPFLYTAVFGTLIIAEFYLRSRILD